MCVVSMVGDHYRDNWFPEKKSYIKPYYPYVPYSPEPKEIDIPQVIQDIFNSKEVTRKEFEALRKEVLEMKKLLQRALEYDKKNNEPDCQIEDKVSLLKKVAEAVGVDLSELK